MVSLRDRLVKEKKLQKLGHSLALIIPDMMIKVLNWNQNTRLQLEVHPIKEEILIIKATSSVMVEE